MSVEDLRDEDLDALIEHGSVADLKAAVAAVRKERKRLRHRASEYRREAKALHTSVPMLRYSHPNASDAELRDLVRRNGNEAFRLREEAGFCKLLHDERYKRVLQRLEWALRDRRSDARQERAKAKVALLDAKLAKVRAQGEADAKQATLWGGDR